MQYFTVKNDATKHWRFQKYELFSEYVDRPIIVGPTLFFWLLSIVLMYVLQARASPWTGKRKKDWLDFRRMDNEQSAKYLIKVW